MPVNQILSVTRKIILLTIIKRKRKTSKNKTNGKNKNRNIHACKKIQMNKFSVFFFTNINILYFIAAGHQVAWRLLIDITTKRLINFNTAICGFLHGLTQCIFKVFLLNEKKRNPLKSSENVVVHICILSTKELIENWTFELYLLFPPLVYIVQITWRIQSCIYIICFRHVYGVYRDTNSIQM